MEFSACHKIDGDPATVAPAQNVESIQPLVLQHLHNVVHVLGERNITVHASGKQITTAVLDRNDLKRVRRIAQQLAPYTDGNSQRVDNDQWLVALTADYIPSSAGSPAQVKSGGKHLVRRMLRWSARLNGQQSLFRRKSIEQGIDHYS